MTPSPEFKPNLGLIGGGKNKLLQIVSKFAPENVQMCQNVS